MTYNSRAFYVGDGATTVFAIPFPYLAAAHITVYLNGALTGLWVFASPTTISFTPAPAGGTGIEIRRTTPSAAPLHTIQTGTISPSDINADIQQVLYIAQETADLENLYASSITNLLTAAQAAAGQAGANLWARPVKALAAAVPGSPAIGDRYLLTANPNMNQVAEYAAPTVANPGGWLYSGTPLANQILDVGNTAYRYSQEAYDSGVAWRPAFYAGGGARGQGAPTDQPGAIEAVAVVGRPVGISSTGIGITAPFHTNNSRGVPGAMTALLVGDNIGSWGGRTLYDVNGLFMGSATAIEMVITQNGTGLIYPASYIDLQTAASGVRNSGARVTQNRCLLVNMTTELSQFCVQADNGLRAGIWYGLGSGSQTMMQLATSGQVMATGFNAANTVLAINKDATTGRSLNLAGTIGASGSDYADFETKRPDCGAIPKGAIVGYDLDGLLTDKFSLAVSFGIKSTDPSFVGGDTHITEATHGARPENPGEPMAPHLERDHRGVRDADPAHGTKDCPVCAAHEDALASFHQGHAAWEAYMVALPEAQTKWDAAAEVARATVDRIAKAGKVPVIVLGALHTGGYIRAIPGPNDTIVGECFRLCVGGNIVGRIRVANPSEASLRRLIAMDIPLSPAWTAIAEVMHS